MEPEHFLDQVAQFEVVAKALDPFVGREHHKIVAPVQVHHRLYDLHEPAVVIAVHMADGDAAYRQEIVAVAHQQ